MQSENTTYPNGLTSAPEELGDNDATESELEKLSNNSGDITAPAESFDDDDGSDNSDGEDTVGEWQDWRCQQAVEQVPEVTPLCNACKYFFGEYQPFTRHARVGRSSKTSLWLRFLATSQVLQSSARSGCAFCKLILACIRRRGPGFEPAEAVKIKVQVIAGDTDALKLLFIYMGRTSPRSTTVRSDTIWIKGSRATDALKDGHEVLPNTYSTNNLELIASWVARCSTHQSVCNPQYSTDSFRPTRLLDLCSSDDMSTITLVESSELRSLGSRSRYLALSHCWGGNAPIVLTSNNICSSKSGINLSELPKTFQHAVALARFLHVRYLWIDSLCIMQDSYTDWEFEASTMKDVYRHAFLTIAATGAETSDDGLYFNRDIDLVRAVDLVVSWQGIPSGIRTFFDSESSSKNILHGPLNQRAWVVQEHQLSLRTLHFGREKIAWECQTLRACETFPGEQPEESGNPYDVNLLSSLRYCPMNVIRNIWPLIAEIYARCGLTKETDKCMAISGIAQEIQLATGDLYFAGLWRSSFVEHLCWIVHHLSNETQRRTRIRPLMYRAPSWSWLSIDSNIQYYRSFMAAGEKLFDILRVEIGNTGPNKFGSIKGGYFIGRGVLKPAMWGNRRDDLTGRLWIDDQYVEHGSFWNHLVSSQVTMDLGHQERYHSVCCLPLFKDVFSKCFNVRGLILVPTHRAEKEYKRIGGFHFKNELAENFLKEWTEATHQVITII